jgi:hypothetical protein
LEYGEMMLKAQPLLAALGAATFQAAPAALNANP